MAGKRHHYLPKFLLSGFCFKQTGKESYCWVYRKTGSEYETNIKNIGVEGYFYGRPEETDLDDRITCEETEFANLVQSLRSSCAGILADQERVSRLVVHLALRTKNVRSTFELGVTSFMNDLLDVVSDPEKCKELVLNSISNDPDFIVSAVEGELIKQGKHLHFNSIKKSDLRSLILSQAPMLAEEFAAVETPAVTNFIEKAIEIIPSSVGSGHIGALEKGSAPEKRVRGLSNIEWELLVFPKHSVILGDVGVWVEMSNEEGPIQFSHFEGCPNIVCLPLSHSHVLIGKPFDSKGEIDLAYINKATASLSFDFFVSSRKNTVRKEWVKIIRSKSQQKIEELTASSISEVVKMRR